MKTDTKILKNSIKYEVKLKFVGIILYTITLNFDKCVHSSYIIVLEFFFLTYIGHSCYDISTHIDDKMCIHVYYIRSCIYLFFIYIVRLFMVGLSDVKLYILINKLNWYSI